MGGLSVSGRNPEAPGSSGDGQYPTNSDVIGFVMGIENMAEISDYTGPDSVQRGQLILLDSGSDEHMCPQGWHPDADLMEKSSQGRLRDVQGNPIEEQGRRMISMDFEGWSDQGDTTGVRTSSCFTVGPVREPLLSAGKIVQAGGTIHYEMSGSYIEIGGKRIEVEMVGNRFAIRPWRTVAAVMPSRHVAAGEMEEELLDMLAEETAGQGASSSAGPSASAPAFANAD